MIWNVTVPFLLLAVIVLLWRVRRLSASVKSLEATLVHKANAGWVSEWMNESMLRCGKTEQRVFNLAHALGYEWKRTEAKEGWEKMPVLFYSAAEAASILGDVAFNYAGLNRRKADRRKASPKKAASKPSRATH